MSEQKNLSTEIKFNGSEKYNKLLCLFHIGTDVKRKLLDTFLKEKQIILLDWLTSRSNAFLLFEDVKNARRKSATIVLEDLVLNTIDKVLWDCLDFFWDCCLKDDSLEDILERHKELLYRKHVNSNNQQDSNSLTEDQWDILFKRKHEKDIETDQEENEQCFSATKGITISHLDSKLNILILSTVCPLFKSVSAVSECQSQISKIAVLQREVKDNEFEKIWDKFENHIHKISSHCQLSDFFKRKCTIIKECKVNKILTQQNRKSILVEALNFPDFIPDTKLCDDVRKELKFIDFEENLNIARAHCGRKIPVEFTTGQCEEGSYLRNWIEFAENDLQTLSSLHSRQVIDPYQEEVDVAQQTDDTQERLCKHNHLKLVQLITETARDVLADVLKKRIPIDGLGASFDGMKNKILPLLDIQERHVLYPENSNYKGDLSDLDISLIYIILRNLNTICPHKNGWGNKPNDDDRCLSANIDRIRIAKNVHVSHCSKRLLNDEDFQKTWKEIRQCIIELVEPLPSRISYVDRIDFLLTSAINPGTEIELFNMHERAKKEERRLEQKINYLQECINDIQYQLNVNNRQSDNELKAAEFLGNGTKQASQTAADMTKKLQVTDKGIKIVKFGNVTLELRIEGEDIPSVEEIEPYSQTLTTHEVRINYIKEGSIIIGIDVSQSAFQNVGHFLEIIDTLVSSVFQIHIQKGNGRKIQASVSLDFLDNNNEPVSFSKRSLQRVENKEKRDEAAICCDVMGGTESVLLRKHQQKQNDLTICQPILVQRSISDTEQGLRILSCFKKTDQSPGNTCLHYTDGTHINHETRDTGKENGLKKYFERISSGTPVTTVDSMSNELLRLSSFSNFPSDINISLIKLAKTGFYYTGRRNTKCFSCGVTYDKWKSGDDPVVIHKMLSPSCALVNETRFSSSANQEERTTVVSNNTDSTVDTRTVTSHGLNQSENTSSTYEPRLQISSSYNGTSNNVQERQGNQQSSLSNRNRSSSATGNSQETQTSKENKNATGTSSCQHNTEFESLGIHLEKPKYQNYACLTVKISSFQGWPSYRDQPMFADETVYFSCGLGLRNWKADDDPWVEHARWFPKCTFLKQNKGEKFINAVQKRLEEIDYQTDETNENNQETEQRDQLAHITFLLYGRILCCFDCARIMRTCLVFMKYFKEFVKQILWIHQSNRYKDMFS